MKSQKGFTIVEVLLVVLVVAVIGFGGYTVWNNNQDDDAETNEATQSQSDTSQTNEDNDNDGEDDEAAQVAGTFTSYSVNQDTEFENRGTCTSGDVLFAPIYNADSYDYDCGDFDYQFGYASVFFGETDKDAAKLVDANYSGEGEVVELSDGNYVTKHVITVNEGSKADGGQGGDVEATYIVYAANKEGGGQFYAVYRTVPAYSDHNFHLDAFENTVINDWLLT